MQSKNAWCKKNCIFLEDFLIMELKIILNSINFLFKTVIRKTFLFNPSSQDLAAEIRKVAQFLKKSPTEDYIEKMVKHLSFDSMKNNSAVNNESIMSDTSADNNIKFMRKGIVSLIPKTICRFCNVHEKWRELTLNVRNLKNTC